tara:strand:+ start:171 stop:407 length:237 start_codon:yes stop_codon:yes gene_type:complete
MKLRTRKEIELNLGQIVPGVKGVSVLEDSNIHLAKILVKLPWWKWLVPGVIHFIFRKKIERAFCDFGVAGVLYVIDVS